MDKEYFTSINDVSKRLSVPAHTLRYWEKQFPTAIRPTTGAGGRRYYRADTVEKIAMIKDLLYNRGMTIAGVKKMLHDGEFPSADTVANNNPNTHNNVGGKSAKLDADTIDVLLDLLRQAKQEILNS